MAKLRVIYAFTTLHNNSEPQQPPTPGLKAMLDLPRVQLAGSCANGLGVRSWVRVSLLELESHVQPVS